MGIINTEDWGMRDVTPTWVKEQDVYNQAIVATCGNRVEIVPGDVQECEEIAWNNALIGEPIKGWALFENKLLQFPIIAQEGDTAWQLDATRKMVDYRQK